MNKRSICLSEGRDIPILLFVWRWKVVTTTILIQRFFPSCTAHRAYCRLLDLRNAGLLELRTNGRNTASYFILTKAGFKTIRERLPELREEGFGSESVRHDARVSAIHLGDWVFGAPSGCALFSEQQLRRTHPDVYPSWVPRSEIHRSDGYWCVSTPERQSVIALEVELTQKCDSDYLKVGHFYRHLEKVDTVFWVTETENVARKIREQILRAAPAADKTHSFALVSGFEKFGWGFEIILGKNAGKTLRELLPENPQRLTRLCPENYLGSTLLDGRRCPKFSSVYEVEAKPPVPD